MFCRLSLQMPLRRSRSETETVCLRVRRSTTRRLRLQLPIHFPIRRRLRHRRLTRVSPRPLSLCQGRTRPQPQPFRLRGFKLQIRFQFRPPRRTRRWLRLRPLRPRRQRRAAVAVRCCFCPYHAFPGAQPVLRCLLPPSPGARESQTVCLRDGLYQGVSSQRLARASGAFGGETQKAPGRTQKAQKHTGGALRAFCATPAPSVSLLS